MMPQPAARRTARSGSCRRRQSRESVRQTSAMASSRERWVGPKRRTAVSALLEPALAAGMGSHEQHGEARSEEHTAELQSLRHLGCPPLLGKKNIPTSPPRKGTCASAKNLGHSTVRRL